MSILLLLQSAAAPAIVGQSAVTSYYGPNTKAVLRDYFTNVTVPTSVFATKPDLRDTFAGTLNQTPAKVGGDRGYGTRTKSVG